MIYDANKDHDPIGKVDPYVYHRSCAEEKGVLNKWVPYLRDNGLTHCTCLICRRPLRPVTELPTHPHFI